MAAVIGALRAELSATIAKFEADMGKAAQAVRGFAMQANKIGSGMQKVGRQMSASVTLPIIALGVAIGKTAGDFEAAMNRVAAATQAPADQVKKMSDLAREIGPAMGVGPTKVAEAMEMLAKNGLNATQILGGAAKATVLLAKSAGADLAPAADLATDLMAQFNVKAEDMAGVVDKVNGVLIASKLDFDGYRLAVGQAGGAAGKIGVSLNDFNAALAATAPLFSSGSDAGTSFKTFLTKLSPTSKEASAMMDALKLSFFDANGQMKSMADIAQELQDKLSTLSQQDQLKALTTLFGTDAMRTAIGLMAQGAAGIDKFSAAVQNVSAVDQMNAKLAGLNGGFAKLVAVLEELAITIAESGFIQFLTAAVKQMTDLVKWIRESVGEWGQFGMVVAGIAAAIGPALIAIGVLVTTLGGIGTVIRVAVLPALWLMMAHPIIAGGAILGVGIQLLIEHFQELIRWIQETMQWLGDMMLLAMNPAAAQAVAKVRAQAKAGFDGMVQDAVKASGKIATALATKPVEMLVVPTLTPTFKRPSQGGGALDDLLGGGGGGAAASKAEALASQLDRATESIKDLGHELAMMSREDVDGLPERLRQVDDRFGALTEKVNDQIHALEKLGAKGGQTAEAMAGLQSMLTQIGAAHDKATTAAKAQWTAEQALADLRAQGDAARMQGDIAALKNARGDSGVMPAAMAQLQQIESKLNEDRIDALMKLRQMETAKDKATLDGYTEEATRLGGLIELQGIYYDLLDATTAKQIQDQQRVQDAWSTFEDDLSSTLSDSVINWKLSLDDIGNIFANLAKDLWVKPFMEGVTGDISSWLQGITGGSGGGGGSSFGGWFAEGGNINPGQWGIVGDAGMEKARWTPHGIEVEPLGRGGGGGTVIQNIKTDDVGSFRRGSRQVARMARSALGSR